MRGIVLSNSIIIFCFVFFACQNLFTADFNKTYYQEQLHELTLFNADGSPKIGFLGLLETLKIHHEDTTRQSVVNATQKAFFHGGTEYYQIKEDPQYPKKTVIPLLENLELLREYKPQQKYYEGCVFLDGFLLWVRERQAGLIDIWHDGTRFKNIHICTGDHPFDPGHQYCREDFFELEKYTLQKSKLFDEKEYEPIGNDDEYMLKMLFDQVALPEELSKLDKHWIVSKTDPETGARPNTVSNAHDFLACECSPSGHHVVMSNSPHIPYQKIIFLHQMYKEKSKVTIEVVGRKDPGEFNSMQHLDRVARLGYAESKYIDDVGLGVDSKL